MLDILKIKGEQVVDPAIAEENQGDNQIGHEEVLPCKQAEFEQRVRSPEFAVNKASEREYSNCECYDDYRGCPTEGLTLGKGKEQAREADEDKGCTGTVEPDRLRFTPPVAGITFAPRRIATISYRDINEEDPVPGEILAKHTSDCGADYRPE